MDINGERLKVQRLMTLKFLRVSAKLFKRRYSLILYENIRNLGNDNINDYVTGDTFARSEASGKDELNRNSSLAA